jgi:Phosphopantetheine attachment site
LKVRGFRFEPAEVEGALLACPGVRDAAVVAIDYGGEKQLCGVVVPVPGFQPICARGESCSRSACLVPHPAALVLDRGAALTTSGKVDRRTVLTLANSVPARERWNQVGRHLAPRHAPAGPTQSERLLQAPWREVVPSAMEDPVPECSFFNMGGTSLRLLAFHAAMARVCPGAISVADLFKYPTLRKLARHLEGDQRAASRLLSTGATVPDSVEF